MISLKPAPFYGAPFCPGVRGLFTSKALGWGAGAGPYAALNLSYSVGDDPAAVRASRDNLSVAVKDGPGSVAWMRQVHGARVVRVSGPAVSPEPAGDPEADAIFTDVTALGLGVLVADCAPVLLADPVARLAGAAHAGRPGLALGVVPALVAAMTAAGADPGRMGALIGPTICGRCYEVPGGMRDEVEAAAPGSACVTGKGTPGIDIRAGLHRQLQAAGVREVTDDRRCPAESAELYSYRRDGVTGRFAGLVWLA